MRSRRNLFADDDGVRFKTSKREQEADLDITPMIDVTFLLLIYFLVTSTMSQSDVLDLPKAQYGTGVSTNETTTVTIKQGTGNSSVILLQDGTEASLDDVRSYVEERLNSSANIRKVMIKAERETPHGAVQEVARVVSSIEGIEFFIAVEGKESRE